MFGRNKKDEPKAESAKEEGKIELRETSSVTIPQTVLTETVTPVEVEHVHDDNCNHQEEIQQPPPLTRKEAKALKRSDYDKIAEKFNTSYVLKNTKTGQIVEIRAASSFHACNIIGWKPNRVKILSERKTESPPQA